ncbi:MAG: peptidoglycan DD-metalloendopeptidase family protein, partial [Anaerolineae bacterium]
SPAEVIGYSVQEKPISAHRIGTGPIKIALIGDIHGGYEANTHQLVEQLLAYYQTHPGEVPAEISLWLVPTMNPDGLEDGNRWNANDVDLNRNADTDLDGCAGNDWSPDTVGLEGPHPGAGGAYPFSEPESRAVRDFLDDAWIAVFYHSAAEAIFVDTCQNHLPTARLAEILSEGTGYPVPEEGWSGYRLTGDFGDYLAGEGVAAVTVELTDKTDPEFERNLAGVQNLLANPDKILSSEADEFSAEFRWLNQENTGEWRFAENSFLHPLALEVIDNTAYLLDAGRVLAIHLDDPGEPQPVLAPGDEVQGVRVLEPLDLAADGATLLALDRAGDVYRYEPESGGWSLERYARPAGDTSDHYYVSLASDGAAAYLLETSHEELVRFEPGQKGAVWAELTLGRDVDLSTQDGDVYVLTRALNNPAGALLRYAGPEGTLQDSFQSELRLMHPRQVVATDEAIWVLDRAGRRILALDPGQGSLEALFQFPDRREVSAIWADPSGEDGRLLLAGRDALYLVGEPERTASIAGQALLSGPQPHDLDLLEALRGYSVPIEGARVTQRDFQMPGAPRHYRLGVHEGMDFYSGTAGVTVNRRTAVRAVADGVVIRALLEYEPVTEEQVEAWYATSLEAGYTPPAVLDGYRGRQVWIDHGNGVISRYAHLGSIAPGIVEGATVERGQVIATVGNSGTPASVYSETTEVHLHLELWAGNCSSVDSDQCHFVGQFLRPIEAREWLERILR